MTDGPAGRPNVILVCVDQWRRDCLGMYRIDDPDLVDVRRALQDRLLTHYLETSDVVPHTIDPRH
jgi:arylsulfatase A-like enzyme